MDTRQATRSGRHSKQTMRAFFSSSTMLHTLLFLSVGKVDLDQVCIVNINDRFYLTHTNTLRLMLKRLTVYHNKYVNLSNLISTSWHTNWDYFVPKSGKIYLISTLVHIAFIICSPCMLGKNQRTWAIFSGLTLVRRML